MEFKLNFNKIHAFLLALLILVGMFGIVVAYGSGGPPNVFGHDLAELEGVQARIANGLTQCSGSNLAIKTINPNTGAVTCETDDAGGGISGSGSIDTVPQFTGATTIGNSPITVVNPGIGFGSIGINTGPVYTLDVRSANPAGATLYVAGQIKASQTLYAGEPVATGCDGGDVCAKGSANFENVLSGSGADLHITPNGWLLKVGSSERYKNNIRDLENDFYKILEAEAKSFNYRETGEYDIGYIAEEFDELDLNDLVVYDTQGRPDAIQYDKISLYLVEIIKDQQGTIEQQQKQIEKLAEAVCSINPGSEVC